MLRFGINIWMISAKNNNKKSLEIAISVGNTNGFPFSFFCTVYILHLFVKCFIYEELIFKNR